MWIGLILATWIFIAHSSWCMDHTTALPNREHSIDGKNIFQESLDYVHTPAISAEVNYPSSNHLAVPGVGIDLVLLISILALHTAAFSCFWPWVLQDILSGSYIIYIFLLLFTCWDMFTCHFLTFGCLRIMLILYWVSAVLSDYDGVCGCCFEEAYLFTYVLVMVLVWFSYWFTFSVSVFLCAVSWSFFLWVFLCIHTIRV